jgi:predicted metallo-beta-lactamase superfamily hydrolase
VTVCIDPGASAQSSSFPFPAEERRGMLARHLETCRLSAVSSKVLVITHYHLDHFIGKRDPQVYRGKVLFAKAFEDLPPKQRARAEKFHATIDGLPEETVICDGRKFKFGRTEVAFSKPVWHGNENAEPGTVVMVEVKRGKEKVLVSSDVCGPTEKTTTDLVCASKARTVVLDGYPTAHLGRFASDFDLVRSIINVCRVLATKELETLVLDHHLCRDYRYPAFFKLVYAKAKQLKKAFGTAAELMERKTAVLQGYQDYGPTKWKKWFPLDIDGARDVLKEAIESGRAGMAILKELDRWVA